MLKSRVILTGIAVAAAAAAGSAFTAANDFTAPGVADDAVGYGQTTVSGATVSKVVYTPLAGDPSKLDVVEFTSTAQIQPGNVATLYLKAPNGTVVATVTDPNCVIAAWNSGTTSQLITCTPPTEVDINSFNTVALSIMPPA